MKLLYRSEEQETHINPVQVVRVIIAQKSDRKDYGKCVEIHNKFLFFKWTSKQWPEPRNYTIWYNTIQFSNRLQDEWEFDTKEAAIKHGQFLLQIIDGLSVEVKTEGTL